MLSLLEFKIFKRRHVFYHCRHSKQKFGVPVPVEYHLWGKGEALFIFIVHICAESWKKLSELVICSFLTPELSSTLRCTWEKNMLPPTH